MGRKRYTGLDRVSGRLRLALPPGPPRLLRTPRPAPVDALRTSLGLPLASLHRVLWPARRRERPRPLLRLRRAPGGAAAALRSSCLRIGPSFYLLSTSRIRDPVVPL